MLNESGAIQHEHGKMTYFHSMWVVCSSFDQVTCTLLASVFSMFYAVITENTSFFSISKVINPLFLINTYNLGWKMEHF